MKKSALLLVSLLFGFSASSTYGFDEREYAFHPYEPHSSIYAGNPHDRDLYLFKMGAGILNGGGSSSYQLAPSFELAKRFEISDAAVEVGIQYAKLDHDEETKYWSFPKFTYIAFDEPGNLHSLYYGVGMSWSKVSRKARSSNNHFSGLFLEGVLGYEFHRDKKIRTIFEVSVSQPLASASRSGSHPGPSVFASIGFGIS